MRMPGGRGVERLTAFVGPQRQRLLFSSPRNRTLGLKQPDVCH